MPTTYRNEFAEMDADLSAAVAEAGEMDRQDVAARVVRLFAREREWRDLPGSANVVDCAERFAGVR